jgi:hypothetical protein
MDPAPGIMALIHFFLHIFFIFIIGYGTYTGADVITTYTTQNRIIIYTIRDIYSMVECKELFFHTLKNIIQGNKFSRVCS